MAVAPGAQSRRPRGRSERRRSVAVRPRACMALRVKRVAAKRTRWPSCRYEGGTPHGQRCDLLSGRAKAGDTTCRDRFTFLVDFGHLLGDQDELVGVPVVID